MHSFLQWNHSCVTWLQTRRFNLWNPLHNATKTILSKLKKTRTLTSTAQQQVASMVPQKITQIFKIPLTGIYYSYLQVTFSKTKLQKNMLLQETLLGQTDENQKSLQCYDTKEKKC